MNVATSYSAKKSVQDIIGSAALNKANVARTANATQTTVKTNADESIKTNAFYQVMFSQLDPEEKKIKVTELATFAGDKEKSRSLIKEYEKFEEYCQRVRKDMAIEIIKLQDTDAFAILQDTMNTLNSDLIAFESQIKPLTDITDAIYTLRTNEATLDVYREIQDDKEKEAKKKSDEIEAEKLYQQLEDEINKLENSNAVLEQDKSLFGLGTIKKASLQQIALNKVAIERSQAKLTDFENKLLNIQTEEVKAPGQFEAEKAQLRKLLDLTSEEHKTNQKALVDTALNFVKSADEKIGNCRTHLEAMTERTENLLDNNRKMSILYAVMREGLEDAQIKNNGQREEVIKTPEGERSIARMQREDLKSSLDDHIRLVDNAVRTTTTADSDITSQTIRVKTMKDANENVVEQTRIIHTQGVSGIADRLSTTLQAVASAALGESSANAKGTLRDMARVTDQISQRESIKVAMGVNETNNDLIEALENLSTYSEVLKTSREITSKGVSEIRTNVQRMNQAIQDTQDEVRKTFSIAADLHATENQTEPVQTIQTEKFNPFK